VGGGPENVLVGYQGDRRIAVLQLHPLRQWVAGVPLAVSGIATVTISPVDRKQGLAAELMGAAVRASYDRGDVGSALYPFRYSFYRKVGYGTNGRAEQYLRPPAAFPDFDERKQVDLLVGDVAQKEALDLYNTWIKTQNSQLERGTRMWAESCAMPNRALVGYRDPAGALEGYALVTYRADSRERFLDVEELVFTTAAARRGLYGWLSSLGDQWELIMVRALPSHRLEDWLVEPGLPRGITANWGLWKTAAFMLDGPMFRLVNMLEAWRTRAVSVRSPFSVSMDIADAQIEENAGSWILDFADGRVDLKQGAGAKNRIRTDISTVSRLFTGALNATDAQTAGLLTSDDPAALRSLDEALALPEPWTFDRF
jgi:predicted acetyltransferase